MNNTFDSIDNKSANIVYTKIIINAYSTQKQCQEYKYCLLC